MSTLEYPNIHDCKLVDEETKSENSKGRISLKSKNGKKTLNKINSKIKETQEKVTHKKLERVKNQI